MDWIAFFRILIWVTFLLLIIEGISAIFIARLAARYYVRRHLELVQRVERLEKRQQEGQ